MPPMQLHIANLLTIGRLALVPVFLAAFFLGWYHVAFVTFSVAAMTDLVDGTIARWQKKRSQLGAFLDPLADKVLMITTFACLVSVRSLPAWFLGLVIARDVMIMGGIGVLKVLKIKVAYKPFLLSKFATLSQILLGVLSLGVLWSPSFSFGVYPMIDFAEGVVYVTAILVIVTGLQYVKKGMEILQARG